MSISRTVVSVLVAAAVVISGCVTKPEAATNSTNEIGNQTVMPAPIQSINQTESSPPVMTGIYIQVSPPGSGNVTPSTGNYTQGSNVTFVATPADPYVFAYWTYDYTLGKGGGTGSLGKNQTLNLMIGRSENITANFVASPAVWDSAVLYGEAYPTVLQGEYFIIAQAYTGGPYGPDSIAATYDERLVALIDRKPADSNNGPVTPGYGTGTAWLLFKALKPGVASISLKQVVGSYVTLPKGWSVTIVGNWRNAVAGFEP